MSARPKVSVVINNHDYERYVALAVDSALAQTYSDVEVVVVDDGSSDGSREVLSSYADRVLLLDRPNGGQGAAVNTGFAGCSGDIVLFLDADDLLLPDACTRVVEAWRPGIAKVHFRLRGIDAEGRALGWLHPNAGAALPSGDLSADVLATGACSAPVMSGNAFARWALERALPVPEDQFRISADGYLVTAAALLGEVVAIDEALGCYRLHGSNAWSATAHVEPSRATAYVCHDLERHAAVRRLATATGRTAAPDLGRRDPAHLQRRLVSLRLAPALHPVPQDSRTRLALQGAVAAWRTPMWSVHRRLMVTCWFAAVAAAPGERGRSFVGRSLVHRSRPPAGPAHRRRRLPLRSMPSADSASASAAAATSLTAAR